MALSRLEGDEERTSEDEHVRISGLITRRKTDPQDQVGEEYERID